MKTKKLIVSLTIFMILIFAGNAAALNLGTNITIWDRMGSGPGWNGGSHEDQEVEPGNQIGQIWDLEGFFLNGTTLTMVAGYDFLDGQTGNNRLFESGDLFLDIDNDAQYGPDNTGSGGGNTIVNNTFGYDYVVDFNFTSGKYNVYSLNSGSTVNVYYGQNDESNPWRYDSGGTLVDGYEDLDYQESHGLSDADVAGLLGGSHYALAVDLAFLGSDISNFIAHFTIECGNDNMMGSNPVPEPASMLLVGSGLIGLAGFGRRKFFKRT